MIEYSLLKFNGDREINGKATAIIDWTVKGKEDDVKSKAVQDMSRISVIGIVDRTEEYDELLNRWIITLKTISKDIVITIDVSQKRTVIIADNEDVRILFKIVYSILNFNMDRDIMYRLKKILKCICITINTIIRKGR